MNSEQIKFAKTAIKEALIEAGLNRNDATERGNNITQALELDSELRISAIADMLRHYLDSDTDRYMTAINITNRWYTIKKLNISFGGQRENESGIL